MTGNDYFLHFFAEQVVLFKLFIFHIDFSQRKRHVEILIIKLFIATCHA